MFELNDRTHRSACQCPHKKDRADEAVRKSKQKNGVGKVMLVSSSLCGAGRRKSSGTNHAVRVNTVTRKTTLDSLRMNKIRNVSSAPLCKCMGILRSHSTACDTPLPVVRFFSKPNIVAVVSNATNCVLLKKLMVPQLVKEFLSSHET